MADAPPPFFDSATPAASVVLYCPDCGYNLSGTTQDRCSECGHDFDRAALFEWTTSRQQSLPFGALVRRYHHRTLFEVSLFSPSLLGRLLPPHADAEAAKRHSLIMRLWAAVGVPFLFLLILAACVQHAEPFLTIFFISIPVLIVSVFCEALLAILLGAYVPARAVPPEYQGKFWRTLVRCFSTHLLVSFLLLAIAIGVMVLGLYANRFATGYQPLNMVLISLPYLTSAVSVLWWWYGLGQAIAARGAPGTARAVIIFLIPVIALVGIALGFAMIAGAILVLRGVIGLR